MLVSLRKALRLDRRTPDRDALLAARSAGIATLREVRLAYEAEIRRARRYERPLALLAIAGEHLVLEGGTARPAAASLAPPAHLGFLWLGLFLRDTMRELDVVAYSAEHQLYVALLPETGPAQVRGAIRRIGSAAQERMQLRLRTGLAEFPNDGGTVESLFDHARAACAPQLFVARLPHLREGASV